MNNESKTAKGCVVPNIAEKSSETHFTFTIPK